LYCKDTHISSFKLQISALPSVK